jgi:hypothetical protein
MEQKGTQANKKNSSQNQESHYKIYLIQEVKKRDERTY